jgi:hypothetical protein
MWQELFCSQHTRTRLADGPWGMYLEEFATALAQDRYSVETVRRSLCAADHFGRWLLAVGSQIAGSDVNGGYGGSSVPRMSSRTSRLVSLCRQLSTYPEPERSALSATAPRLAVDT